MEVNTLFSYLLHLFPLTLVIVHLISFTGIQFGSLDGVVLIGASFYSKSGYSNGESLLKIWDLSLLYTKKVSFNARDRVMGLITINCYLFKFIFSPMLFI